MGFVFLILSLVIFSLIKEHLRPGLVLLSGAVAFLCAGIISPAELLAGFANKGMITVAMLFLVSEGVRRSGLLENLLHRLLPKGDAPLSKVQWRMLPVVSGVSAFLNNTPVVVIFAPMVKRWAEKHGLAPTKLLIPLSYATILGGMCTLIGTSTNLVVHGMVVESGGEGFSMFELAWVGVPIAVAGICYVVCASGRLLPEAAKGTPEVSAEEEGGEGTVKLRRVEVVLGARFPALGKRVIDFDFKQKYGALILEMKRGGETIIMHDMRRERFRQGDTLVLLTDEHFMANWGDSSFFLMVDGQGAADADGVRMLPKWKRYAAVVLLLLMITGATLGELPAVKAAVSGVTLDMFFFVCVTTVVMAWMNLFPARKYTKFISWDILVTIASAFAISKAMQNSGMADAVAAWAVGLSNDYGPLVLLAVVFVITNLFTELMTNNAAAALAFPISLAIAEHLGVSAVPFFVTICVAASSSFSTPIGYQTNLIVQGIGGYRFTDFVKIGLPLNLLALALTLLIVPKVWPF